MRDLTEDELHRFYLRVESRGPDERWPWLGSKNERGYGKFGPRNKESSFYAHRVMAKLKGLAIEGLDVMHSCDNPSCVNPNHLSTGTRKDNMQDCKAKGRNSKPPINRPTEYLTPNDVKCIVLFRERGLTQKTVAKMYNVATSTISAIDTGRNWSDVTLKKCS